MSLAALMRYKVRSTETTTPDAVEVLKHEEFDWLTLITCLDYDAINDTYSRRTIVRAVLVEIR